MKKLNLAIIILLLVFQTVLSPISVLADEGEPPVTPPTESSEDAGTGSDGEGDDPNVTSGDTAEVTTPEDKTKPEEKPQLMLPLGAPVGYPAENMQADVTMSFSGLKLFSQGGTLITNATDLANYSGAKPKKGDVVYLNYTFPVNPTIDYGIGSTFTFQLPANMIEEYTPGSFNQSRTLTETGDWLAYSSSYNSATKTVTVTLDSELEQGQVGSMNFEFMAKFGNFADESELEQSLIIPVLGGANVQLDFEFAPAGNGQLLSKNAGSITRNASGEVTIPWTVWVNTGGQKLESASLNDVPDVKHELTGDITVERYKIGLNGFDPNNPGVVNDISTGTAFPIALADGYYAYKITYNTVVTTDPTASSMQYTNVATLTGTNIPANTTANGSQNVQYGPSLDKARSGDKYNSTWTIKYNWLGQKIPADKAKLTDTLTGSSPTTGKHKINYSSFKVYRVTLSNDGQTEQSSTLLSEGQDYSFDSQNNDDFIINFDHSTNTTGPAGEVTSAFKIVYDTELEDEFVTDANTGTITNTVTRGDSGSDTATIDLTPNIFNKARGAIDYVNKTIIWTLTINAEKDLKDFVIEDDFTTTNKAGETLKHTLTSWNGTDFYEVTGANGLAYTITDKTGNAPAVGNEGFKVEFSSDIPKDRTVTIRYKTKYDIKPNGGVATAYINTADANWDGAKSSNNQALDRTANYTPDSTSPTNNNGYKKVTVDNHAQEFSWRIGVNINKQDINNATLKDTLGAGHYIPVPDDQTLKDQITISKLKLTTEEGTKDGVLDPSKWNVTATLTDSKVTGFEITFVNLDPIADNNEAYLIEYKTKDADDIYGQNSSNPRNYTNAATLDTPHNGSYNYNATATISNLANQLISKVAKTDPAKDIIDWTVTVNASNSNLGNITLTDTPSSNQKILTNTFKKQEIKMNTNGTSQNVGTPITVDASEIVLKPDGSFSLDLGELNGKGYVVTYSTFFMGDGNAGETISNNASIGYAGATAAGTSDQGGDSKLFKYSSSDTSASGVKGTLQLKKFKVNPLTGTREEFPGVKFELWNKNNTVKLEEKTTGADGTLTFEQVRYGKYTLRETTPAGYVSIAPITITMGATIDITSGVDGKAYVIENIEDVSLTNACPAFTLTVKDIDGKAVANKNIKLVDSNGVSKYTGTTNAAGKVSDIKRPGTGGKAVQAGKYNVMDENDNPLGTVIVKYGQNECHGEVQPVNSCPIFTITVNDEQNNPRPNVTVTLKNASNTVITTATTDGNGKITIPSTTPSGTYKLYEGTVFLGNVEVSYQNGKCEATITQAPTCEVFTLTVNDVDGKPRQGVTVEIKDKNNPNAIVPQPSSATDANGKVTIQNIKPGEYEVYENGTKIGEFTVDTDCKETIQPLPACPVFTLTVKDEDGILAEGTEVTITNTATKDSFTAIVGKNGKVTFPSATTPSGKYEVSITASGKVLDEFDVTYSGNCEDTAEKPRACDIFTITVKDTDGSLKGNTKVIVEDSNGNVVTTGHTDANGEIQLPQNQSPGMYTVYEETDSGAKGDEIGKVKVTYTDGCKGVVQKNACPVFTLTVNDKNLKPVGANVLIVIKNQAGDVVTSGKTDASGKIVFEDKTKLQQGQNYVVFNEAGIKLGDITVSYADNICGATVQVPNNACPIFTLTVQDLYGYGRPNVAFTIKDLYNNTIASGKTNEQGVGTIPYTVQPGIYNVYEGNVLLGTITVTDGCSGLVKPSYTGGGGWIPPNPDPGKPVDPKPNPGKPGEPTDPTTNPGKPGKPTDPTTNPGKPGEPTDPTTNPGKPGEPIDPTTNPGKPGEPTDPTTNPGKPGEPTDPTTNPGKPGEPTDPTTNPGKPGEPTDPTTNPGKTEASKPSVQNVIDQGKKLPPYNPTKATKDTLDAYNDFLNKYSLLTKEEQKDVAESLDIDKIKMDAKRLENQLKAQGKLPQTDGADQTALTLIGVALVLGALFFLRRRKAEIK